jgi:hypothetical protein
LNIREKGVREREVEVTCELAHKALSLNLTGELAMAVIKAQGMV